MTGRKKQVSVSSTLAYGINCNTTKEIKTSLRDVIQSCQYTLLDGAAFGPYMILPFDNFDELTGALSGVNTMQDTMGVLCQNEEPNIKRELTSSGTNSSNEIT